MSGACLRLLLALGLTGVATLAPAQQKKTAPTFAVPGSADSVSAGSKEARPARRAHGKSRANAAVATFPGFRLLPDGRSRIYVELTRSVGVDERRAEGMLIYVLHDARVPVRNNRNALITTHFSTPVGRARLLSAGPDVELIIDLRKSVTASQKVVAGENGGARLEVDFPAGDYPPVPGLFEPQTGKGRAGDTEEAAPSDSTSGQGAAAGASTAQAPSSGSPPAEPARAAPSATPPSTPPAR